MEKSSPGSVGAAISLPPELEYALERRGLQRVFETVSHDVARAMARWVERGQDLVRVRRINLIVEMAASMSED